MLHPSLCRLSAPGRPHARHPSRNRRVWRPYAPPLSAGQTTISLRPQVAFFWFPAGLGRGLPSLPLCWYNYTQFPPPLVCCEILNWIPRCLVGPASIKTESLQTPGFWWKQFRGSSNGIGLCFRRIARSPPPEVASWPSKRSSMHLPANTIQFCIIYLFI